MWDVTHHCMLELISSCLLSLETREHVARMNSRKQQDPHCIQHLQGAIAHCGSCRDQWMEEAFSIVALTLASDL